jgi:hypothetical protein
MGHIYFLNLTKDMYMDISKKNYKVGYASIENLKFFLNCWLCICQISNSR